ncbi:MAG: ABC transporter ATP-binding protein [Candidatus Margulisiibacteriota bacterium]|jgi:phospholipid/cholesterol/gamma-HCH transport system ATP-binding protein
MIKLKNLTKYFGELKVLENVSLDVRDGRSLAIIGPSGCGKSTLLKLITGLEEPTAGTIDLNGVELTGLNEDDWIAIRKKIGFIFQSSALFDSMSVYENVAFPLREHSAFTEEKIAQVVKEKLKLVELEGIEEMMPAELSGGMQKRVCIARALAFNPTIILYDEPTTGLDPITSVAIENLMIKLKQGVTSIVVTHVLQTVYRVADDVVMVHDGKFIPIGSPEETKRSTNPVVKKFITGGL